MRISIISYWHDRDFKNKKGGPIKVIELADNLRDLGHEAILFLPKLGFPERQTGTPVKQIPVIDIPIIRPLFYSMLNLFSLIFYLLKSKPDIIYIRYMLDFFPTLFARLFRIPCIIEVNDEIYLASSVKGKIASLCDRINFMCATKIIVLTEGMKGKLIITKGVQTEKIVVSSSATNTRIFYPRSKKDCRRKIGANESSKIIGFAGTFIFNYGIDTLIDSSPKIIEQIPRTKFLIVGSGDAGNYWQKKIRRLGMESYFILPGHVLREEAAIYIGAMDVCIAPYHSSRGETSPVKLFDYFACARPVVASAIKAMGAVRDEFPGLILVKPEDSDALTHSLLDVLENQSLYDAAAMRSKEIVFKKYSWRNIAEEVARVSRSIM
jgi:glycosyltransferase involved in cell wall biosynthesis